ncbi:uncharacterized protein DNG_06304 [Cephalotrichum gorgonifer]|uniref:CorA domain-containing protein n=1 Tax=Cephalotrichum gorgonifer TaxID=2041049 RepID=A0AAE8MZD6_9PEZI|nr:uncharacterized protein DNG_06304 [Cephalotrichum gorgonifer]
MEELYRHLGSSSLWSERERDWSLSGGTDIWRGQASGRVSVRHRQNIGADNFAAWLSEDPQKGGGSSSAGSERLSRFARIVFAGAAPRLENTSGDGLVQAAIDSFGLRLAHAYALSCVAGVISLPVRHQAGGEVRTYAVTYHPKLVAIWSSTCHGGASPPSTPATYGYVYPTRTTHAVIFAGKEEQAGLKTLLEAPWWDAAVAAHPMFPCLLCGLMLSQSADATQAAIKADIRYLEAHTGHHTFASRRGTPAATGKELAQLSALASGRAGKLASTARKIRVARELQAFTIEHAREGDMATGGLVEHHARLVDKRLQMQMLDNEYTVERAKIQMDALFNLISQKDSLVGQQTARTSQVVAQSSLQDSSSMKALALVACLFLPGNFVAALFSAPLFSWNDPRDDAEAKRTGLGITPQFNLFWAISVPLTAAVFIAYTAWLVFQKRRWRDMKRDFEAIAHGDSVDPISRSSSYYAVEEGRAGEPSGLSK